MADTLGGFIHLQIRMMNLISNRKNTLLIANRTIRHSALTGDRGEHIEMNQKMETAVCVAVHDWLRLHRRRKLPAELLSEELGAVQTNSVYINFQLTLVSQLFDTWATCCSHSFSCEIVLVLYLLYLSTRANDACVRFAFIACCHGFIHLFFLICFVIGYKLMVTKCAAVICGDFLKHSICSSKV